MLADLVVPVVKETWSRILNLSGGCLRDFIKNTLGIIDLLLSTSLFLFFILRCFIFCFFLVKCCMTFLCCVLI